MKTLEIEFKKKKKKLFVSFPNFKILIKRPKNFKLLFKLLSFFKAVIDVMIVTFPCVLNNPMYYGITCVQINLL